jgi:hypothetical protein
MTVAKKNVKKVAKKTSKVRTVKAVAAKKVLAAGVPVRGSTRFVYVRDRKNFPAGCIAYEITRSVNGSSVTFGVSTHNPADKFSRHVAHQVALGRLNATKTNGNSLGGTYEFDDEEAHINDIVLDLCQSLVEGSTKVEQVIHDFDAEGNARTRTVTLPHRFVRACQRYVETRAQ